MVKKYSVFISNEAYLDIMSITDYLIKDLENENSAKKFIKNLESVIISLENYPHRGSIRKTGKFKNKKFRQIFIDNYILIYDINEINSAVIVHTVFYSYRNI